MNIVYTVGTIVFILFFIVLFVLGIFALFEEEDMSWMEHRSEIEVEIAGCYSQIEELQNRIAFLKRKQKEEERHDELARKLGEK